MHRALFFVPRSDRDAPAVVSAASALERAGARFTSVEEELAEAAAEAENADASDGRALLPFVLRAAISSEPGASCDFARHFAPR